MNFLKKYKNKKNIRYDSFLFALNLAYERNHKTIVETGTARGKKKLFFFNKFNWTDGMSTLIFAEYAMHVDGKLHSCDISTDNIKNAKQFTSRFSNYVNFYVQDSISFLKKLNFKIDFLYLVSLDASNPDLASKHQLAEAKNSLTRLNKNALILLDDKGGKTNLSHDFLINNNFKLINESKQQLLFTS